MFSSHLSRSALKAAGPASALALTLQCKVEQETARNASNRAAKQAWSSLIKHRQYQHRALSTATTPTGATKQASQPLAAVASKTASTPSPPPKNGQLSLFEWYEKHLHERPVITKMITGANLWGIGDIVAQVAPQMVSKNSTSPLEYDLPRTGRAVFFGFAIHAPLAHVHYNFLEWLTVRAGVTGLKIPIFKAFMEQFVYWSWVSNSLYHGAMGAMQGHTPDQIYNRISDVLWETQKAQWVFWIPVQLVNFQFVPVRHQLNVVLLTSIVWTALLSAWYPPQKSDSAESTVQKKDTEKTD